MAICIGKNKGWGPAKRALQAQGITVHFQHKEGVVNYVGAYIYVIYDLCTDERTDFILRAYELSIDRQQKPMNPWLINRHQQILWRVNYATYPVITCYLLA